jgi:hypothetical protein
VARKPGDLSAPYVSMKCQCKVSHPVRIHGDGRRVCTRCRKVREYKRASAGINQGFVYSTRAHEIHKDRRREAKRRACRGGDPRKGGW